MRRYLMGVGVFPLGGALLLATSSLGPSPASAAPHGAASITIKNYMFSPMSVTVTPGAKITVSNKDSTTHTLTAAGRAHFTTGNISGHHSKTITAPTKAGTYHYICNIHQYMMGTIKVS